MSIVTETKVIVVEEKTINVYKCDECTFVTTFRAEADSHHHRRTTYERFPIEVTEIPEVTHFVKLFAEDELKNYSFEDRELSMDSEWHGPGWYSCATVEEYPYYSAEYSQYMNLFVPAQQTISAWKKAHLELYELIENVEHVVGKQ